MPGIALEILHAYPLSTMAGLAALGCVGGFLAGLLGIGGGMILVPFLTFFMTRQGFPHEHVVHIAIATSMATILFTSASSVRAHHRRGAVRWQIAALLAPGIVIGSLVGAQLASAMKTLWLSLLFATFVGFSATQMLIDRKPKPTRELPGTLGMLCTGTVIGLVSALVGAGGAFISVPFMTWCNVRIHNAVATSAALGFPIALAGTVGYVYAGWNIDTMPAGNIGYINVPALLCVVAASVLLAPLGARVAHSMDVRNLRRVFACLLYALMSYMLYKALQPN